jgi:hypothetical protein
MHYYGAPRTVTLTDEQIGGYLRVQEDASHTGIGTVMAHRTV